MLKRVDAVLNGMTIDRRRGEGNAHISVRGRRSVDPSIGRRAGKRLKTEGA